MYLQNPASLAGCGLVNSLTHDPQKSKLASDVFNALDGMGFITRSENEAFITPLGSRFASTTRESFEWTSAASEGVNNYGPFAGLLEQVSIFGIDEIWARDSLSLGFVSTGETVLHNGQHITLSTGSQADTITRTRSAVITWGVATGFFEPTSGNAAVLNETHPAQLRFHDYLMAKRWGREFRNTSKIFESRQGIVERPLSYNQLVKSTKSLRENGQSLQREASLHWEDVVKNRRYVLAHLLSGSASTEEAISVTELVGAFAKHSPLVISHDDLGTTLVRELQNGFVIGTPFKVLDEDRIIGSRSVNLEVLGRGAPNEIKDIALTLANQLIGSEP
jgi:hypothetical protein